METEPLLLKNWGTWRVQSDDQCNDYHRDCQNQQAQERTYYVKSTLRYQVQLLLFQYRFCYLNDHIGRALLCQTAARCCCHISHIPTFRRSARRRCAFCPEKSRRASLPIYMRIWIRADLVSCWRYVQAYELVNSVHCSGKVFLQTIKLSELQRPCKGCMIPAYRKVLEQGL